MLGERTPTPNRRWKRVTVTAQVIAAIGVVLFLRDVCQDADARAREVSLSLHEMLQRLEAKPSLLSKAGGLPTDAASCIDETVDPCSDFYGYACGGWVERTPIPRDKPIFSRAFDGAAAHVHAKLRSIYEGEYPADAPERALADFYTSCMNTTRLNELGAAPLKTVLEKTDRLPSDSPAPTEVGHMIAEFLALDVPCPIRLSVASAGGAHNVLFVNGGGFVLPDASYYKIPQNGHPPPSPDVHAAERQLLQDYYYRLNLIAGYAEDESRRAARSTIGLETIFADWAVTEPEIAVDNVVIDSLWALEQVTASVPWRFMVSHMAQQCEQARVAEEGPHGGGAAAGGAGTCQGISKLVLDEKFVLLGSPRFLRQLELLMRTQPAGMWARYLRTHYLYNTAPLLDARFLAANLDIDASVTGVRAQPSRSDRCVGLVSSSVLSGLSDRMFLARFFPQSSAAFSEAQGLLDEIKAAFIRTLDAVPWMDAATKRTALAKAQKMGVNIGGPAAAYAEGVGAAGPLRDVRADSLLRNVEASSRIKVARRLGGVGALVRGDAAEWSMGATTVVVSSGLCACMHAYA